MECAHAAARSKGTYLAERYHQLARRRGKKKALLAIAYDILTVAYHLLTTDQLYVDPGPRRVVSEARNSPSAGPSANSTPLGTASPSPPFRVQSQRQDHRDLLSSCGLDPGDDHAASS
jgi:hypothetical protein